MNGPSHLGATGPTGLDAATLPGASEDGSSQRFLGIDVGAETIKVLELIREDGALRVGRRALAEHGKRPGPVLLELLRDWDWDSVDGAAVCGRLGRLVNLPRVPLKQAQATGYRFRFDGQPATLISIGSHGFSVLELRSGGPEVFRENSRCSQGTGNFLRQLVERFSLAIGEASELCADVPEPIPLSGRCPVILKTDMTHLANKGEDRARILAGLFDAVCENVLVLVKPGTSPSRVLLLGGVSRSRRVRRRFAQTLAASGLELLPLEGDDALFFEALGCAVVASRSRRAVPSLEGLILPPPDVSLERMAPLSRSLNQVRRMAAPPRRSGNGKPHELILGFDIGSTGSKLVALAVDSTEVTWEGYLRTRGNPVGAAQELLRQFVEQNRGLNPVLAAGVTGSGREIVGSLLTSCYGPEAVFVLNEIAAHAEGALHFDPRVDTIFEIGGQDAKYIRLSGGRVIDCAMNEACSAGTGSFIEEQGQKFAGVTEVGQLGREAMEAGHGVSLGQHCSVFMAEIIDEAVAAGEERGAILAGLHDSIIQNYLHRVKGNRSVGQVIFCQGMPFASDALATAVARQTGGTVIIPPNPGTVGALGIALLARKELPLTAPSPVGTDSTPSLERDGDAVERVPTQREPLDLTRFLGARIEKKDTFVCKATVGCGGTGNKCRIDSLRTFVAEQHQRFTWGGACSLHDKATRKRKLPDLSPNPFREREALVQKIREPLAARRGERKVALSDEFMLKGLFPFFATFIHELGFDLVFAGAGDHAALKRGIQRSNVPFCAPMQLFHGVTSAMAETDADLLFVPMLQTVARQGDEPNTVTCPIVQAGPHILRHDLRTAESRIVAPVINLGEGNLESPEFLESCAATAGALGVSGERWREAHRRAAAVQAQFERDCQDIGRRAVAFSAEHGLTAVVVLGRPYTIYNDVLNSNVPALLREQGALAIPVDCYPVSADTPLFRDLYWGYAHRILRAAHQVRRTPGAYAVYCSNYSCGPDSFNLHFFAYAMEGKPFAVIETDGHAGDAGTKTRLEAFLYCVEQDRKGQTGPAPLNDFSRIAVEDVGLTDMRRKGERVLVPLLGSAPTALAACLRGVGIPAECLLPADAEAVRLGRRQTSGKECLPMALTLGGLLQRLGQGQPDERFVFVMPGACGPCRFGVYNLLDRITLERLGFADRVRVWSPCDTDYFKGLPPGFSALVFSGFMACDLLEAALHDTRPVEARSGASQALHDRYHARLMELVEREAGRGLAVPRTLWQVAGGQLFGVRALLEEAAAEFAALKRERPMPTVALVGEIYARCNPFANDFVIEKLEQRGLRVHLAPTWEWLEYADDQARRDGEGGFTAALTSRLQARIRDLTYAAMARRLGWPARTSVADAFAAAAPYLPTDLRGEAVLTVGTPRHEWRHGEIDAVVNAGPHECMPSKIAEAQLFHLAEDEGLLSLSLPLNGDPIDPEILDSFAFEVHARWRRKAGAGATKSLPTPVEHRCVGCAG
jgi:predicted CoA-substrate-specific enzyme activase